MKAKAKKDTTRATMKDTMKAKARKVAINRSLPSRYYYNYYRRCCHYHYDDDHSGDDDGHVARIEIGPPCLFCQALAISRCVLWLEPIKALANPWCVIILSIVLFVFVKCSFYLLYCAALHVLASSLFIHTTSLQHLLLLYHSSRR